jgi:hypothetical protein
VIALGEESARVLLGRDLSPGGMRVEANSKLDVGAEVQIALHVCSGQDPLVVSARVERDDGPEGLVLQFLGLSGGEVSYLRDMLNCLPELTACSEGDENVPLVVSEILAADRAAGA